METLLREIEHALDAGLFYLALALSLSLPDICAALDSPNGESSGQGWLRLLGQIPGRDKWNCLGG